MRKGITMQVKIGMIAAILCLGSAAASGCKGSFPTAPPTLAAPTAVATATPAGSAAPAPTVTPEAEQEIHFTDINLETVVREKIGKSIGAIRRADVENITELSARVRGITSIESLRYFTSLEELDLYGNRITDFSVLAELPSLKKLNIAKNYNVLTSNTSGASGLDLTPLKGLVLLEELDASDNMLTDLTVLGSLSALQTLTLANNRITDISPLAGCKSLTYVDLSYNYGLNSDNTERGISDLSPLFENTQLRTLIAGHNLISDVEGIEALEELSYLDLTDNYLDSLAPLAEAASLETVLLHSNALTSLDPLAGNTTIRTLDVSLNMISNFDAINTMPALRSLTWEQNNIQDYSAIDAFEERMSALQNRRQKLQGN